VPALRRRPAVQRLPDACAAFLALYVEFAFQPPFWLHAILWVPLILVLGLGTLRPLKGLMIAIQYKHKAEEGRLEQG
jgi:uncharacterized protein (DUF983 family)